MTKYLEQDWWSSSLLNDSSLTGFKGSQEFTKGLANDQMVKGY
jgi:hypothetical protein